jgi:hypothetical protein
MSRNAACHPIYDRVERLLLTVNNPGHYAGAEFNAIRKEPDALRLRWGLAVPDQYQSAFAHPELAILYDVLNRHPDVGAERVFLPNRDLERALIAERLPLFTLETRTPLSELDILHFSVPDIITQMNVPAMLDLAGIAPLAADRDQGAPLILASGESAFTPEPLADLIDLFLVGEIEDAVQALSEKWHTFRAARLPRTEIILELARTIDGAYAPAFYRAERDSLGRPTSRVPDAPGLPDHVLAARVIDFDRAPIPERPPVAGVRTARDVLWLEINRGTEPDDPERGLDPSAPVSLPPLRSRDWRHLLDALESQFLATGHEDIVLSLSRPDAYPDLARLISGVRTRFRELRMHVTIPGLSLDRQLELMDPDREPWPGPAHRGPRALVTSLESTPALARLSSAAARSPDRERLLGLAGQAYGRGFQVLEVDAAIGVPDETDADLEAVGTLVRDLAAARRAVDRRFGRVELCTRVWIPRPHTPFEEAALNAREALVRKLSIVRRAVGRRREIRIHGPSPDLAILEALLRRGDRRLGPPLVRASRAGIRILESRDEVPDLEQLTNRLFEESGIDPATLFDPDETGGGTAPWSHVRIVDGSTPGREDGTAEARSTGSLP